MFFKEFRVVMPMTLDEYKIGQLYSTMKHSKEETGGGEGFEWLVNDEEEKEIFGEKRKVQFTDKLIHINSKLPKVLSVLAPKGSCELRQKSDDAYPFVSTQVANPTYMKDQFYITIDSVHLPDRGTTENALNLDADTLSKREVINIDIANTLIDPRDYTSETDPKIFKSVKTGRGLLGKDWIAKEENVMCCYKLFKCEFKWFGIGDQMTSLIAKFFDRAVPAFHRRMFCWIDEWYGLEIEEIRKMEEKTKKELDVLRTTEPVRGMSER